MRLREIFENNTGPTINKWSHYFRIYERYFSQFVGSKCFFLEIGVGNGGSGRMWKEYFGSDATVVSIDVRLECKAFEAGSNFVRIGDQSDPTFLNGLVSEFGAPTMVLDDGSHIQNHQLATLSFLYPHLPDGGIYMVEDTHTAYWPTWGGGLRRKGTFIEEMKTVIDGLHADNPHNVHQSRDKNIPNAFALATTGIHFYPSIVVLEKGAPEPKIEMHVPSIPGQLVY